MYTVYFSKLGYPATIGNWHNFNDTHWNEQPTSGSLLEPPAGKNIEFASGMTEMELERRVLKTRSRGKKYPNV